MVPIVPQSAPMVSVADVSVKLYLGLALVPDVVVPEVDSGAHGAENSIQISALARVEPRWKWFVYITWRCIFHLYIKELVKNCDFIFSSFVLWFEIVISTVFCCRWSVYCYQSSLLKQQRLSAQVSVLCSWLQLDLILLNYLLQHFINIIKILDTPSVTFHPCLMYPGYDLNVYLEIQYDTICTRINAFSQYFFPLPGADSWHECWTVLFSKWFSLNCSNIITIIINYTSMLL